MSEPDKKSGSAAEGSGVVLVEQSAASRHKQPFRSSELQEETADLHHKRSKAPAVPSSMVEDFKESTIAETKDRRLKDNVSSERSHTHAAKKLSHVKKRESSPETITLAAMDPESKVGTKSPTTQPIPAQVSEASTLSDISIDKIDDKKDEDDISEDVAELRSPESNRANWESPPEYKSKEVVWHQDVCNDIKNYDRTIPDCKLQRCASVGPCFYPTTPSGRPSGISICVPKKSIRSVRELYNERQSTINFNIAKKWQPDKRKSVILDDAESEENQSVKSNTFLGSLKVKISNIWRKN